jgi:hypothetical protein
VPSDVALPWHLGAQGCTPGHLGRLVDTIEHPDTVQHDHEYAYEDEYADRDEDSDSHADDLDRPV